MLDDRPYMRQEYGSSGFHLLGPRPASLALMISLVVAFCLQAMGTSGFIGSYFALSPEGLIHGRIWQFLTFQFLHADFFHLLFNLVGLWFFGRFAEERLGKTHFLLLYFLSGIAGGLLQVSLGFALPNVFPGQTLGASAGICGLIAAFSILEPDGMILLFFVLPVRAKYLLYISMGIAAFFTVTAIFGSHTSAVTVAHAAHLGGILFGVFYTRKGSHLVDNLTSRFPSRRSSSRQPPFRNSLFKSSSTKRNRADEPSELPSKEFMSQEVDPILDKISAHGIQSLTERERQILQAARNRMSKR